ncbi:MAG: hypothetical protein EOO20_01855 [Chryseobacterium sp.]|nr:MAG: hypothetical protein EOO20_01855 [Chryseobacterium sp.]
MADFHILIPVKFTHGNIDRIISDYYDASFLEENNQIIVDLSLLEWISTEEIAFLFAWIRGLLIGNKKVTVWMPYPYSIYEQHFYRDTTLLKQARALLPHDGPDHVARRINRNIFLLSVWGMLENIGLEPTAFKNIVEGFNQKSERVKEKFSHLVVPFTVISSSRTNSYHHNPYSDVISGSKTFRKVGPFDLNDEIIERLQDFNCYSPFENKIISNVITKELFANSLIHANKSGKLDGIEECYFTLSLNNRWENTGTDNFINQFRDEKDPDTLDFYKDKGTILKDFKRRVKLIGQDELKSYPRQRPVDLSRYMKEFRNISYLEFTFLDFGDGIYKTLAEKFDSNKTLLSNSGAFKNERPENQILEYAFFAESSSDQYNSRLQTPELFPRGLYFLIDMVRRYKGLLVVRSGPGKVVYDFSDRVTLKNTGKEVLASISRSFLLADSIRICKQENAFFDGTMVSIILPERENNEVSYAPVRIDSRKLYSDIYFSSLTPDFTPRKIFATETYEYISMLFLYENVIRNISPMDLSMVKGFDSLIYIELLEQLKTRMVEGTLVFIDFEFYPRIENISQLLFYLTNSPYITEHSKAVIINLSDSVTGYTNSKNIYSVLNEFKINLFATENEPHIFRPIPSINFNMYNRKAVEITDIRWIGVEDENDEILLTNLLLGNREDYPLSKFKGRTGHAGNAFAINQDNLHPIFNTSLELISHFETARAREIFNFATSLIDDGLLHGPSPRPYIFHSSVGSYQHRYLSFYETLHNKYLAKYLAKRLLDSYLALDRTDLKFDKIITVTVSSQLIGVAIRDLIKDDSSYRQLKIGSGNSVADCPALIMLASYYSYETEKPFRKIFKDDNILIVNDVISTGNLVKKLVAKTIGKGARIAGVMAIADCRRSKEDEALTGIPFLSLITDFPKNLEIINYPDIQSLINSNSKNFHGVLNKSTINIKRINPLLNTVIELSNVDAETHRVLFNDPEIFLPEGELLEMYQSRFFKIGHFAQNLSHNGYLTEMRSMFSEDEGKRIVGLIKERIEEEYSSRLYTDSDDDVKIFSMISMANQLKDKETGRQLIEQIKNISSGLKESQARGDINAYQYSPDFIFFPIFSGIENLQTKYFHDTFGTPYENIIGLQRFETDKGWRFPFPPKRFNNITQNKHIMIFDSGALTGESLIQMIDTISILDVAHIDMFSVIGRIEDFNREFFSRIKSLKVKALHKNYNITSTGVGLEETQLQTSKVSFANLNIYFGINLHIPVYPSKSNCPFCEEMRELQSYNEQFLGLKFPKPTKAYITSRLNELKILDFGVEKNIPLPKYIPQLKTEDGTLKLDVVSIFLMRDKLGRIDSYRFYREYYKPFDAIIKDSGGDEKQVGKDLELIMICILHEPKLYKVHRDLLVGIHDRCQKIINAAIHDETRLKELQFDWSKYAMIRLFFIYTRKNEYNLTVFERLFSFASGSDEALNYLAFMLWKGFRNFFKDNYIKKITSSILSIMSDNFDSKDPQKPIYQDNKVRDIIKSIVNTFETTEVRDINDAFFNLRKFFFSQSSDNSHSEIKRNILHLIGDIQNKDLSEEEVSNLLNMSINVMKTLHRDILDNLTALRHDATLKNCDELQFNTLFRENSVYLRLKALTDAHTEMLSNMKNIIQFLELEAFKNFIVELDRFQVEFLLEGTPFVAYCRGYLCDLQKCISSALTRRVSLEIKKRTNFVIVPFVQENIFVNGHNSLLIHAFEEIFFNAAHCAKNDGATVTMTSNTSPESGTVELVIFQDRPFIDSPRINGIDKIIKPIFQAFCGEDGIVFDYTKKHYKITIKFNKFDLNNY